MTRYISLLRFTDKGAAAMRQSTRRAKAFRRAVAKAGVKVEAQYWALGSCDGVLILNGSKDTAVLRALARLASSGYVRTETLPLLTDAEFDAIQR